ncbi:hypothetical protein HJ112_23515, partial [Vibrio parahaemolyticus]|nr:hypothetical protein [Vibrio parahaemolyticus]
AALLSIEGAQHEILFETDQYRNQALDAIFRFMDDPTRRQTKKCNKSCRRPLHRND